MTAQPRRPGEPAGAAVNEDEFQALAERDAARGPGADTPPVDAQPVEPLHWPTLVFQDGDGDLCRCDCGEQGFDFRQGREWFAQHLATLDAARAGDGLLLRGYVIDAGGGEVRLMVDRDTLEYPELGTYIALHLAVEGSER